MSHDKTQKTLYETLGGKEKLHLIVSDFYQTILNDETCNHFYIENVSDIAKLHHTVTNYFCGMFGGPMLYQGQNMKKVHEHMKIRKTDFQLVWQHMKNSFLKHGASKQVIERVRNIIFSMESDIVNTLQ